MLTELAARFAAPPVESRPWAFWFLNDDLPTAELLAQLDAFAAAGFTAPVVRSVTPTAGNGTFGALMPLCAPSQPPSTTRVTISSAPARSTRSSSLPSSSRSRSPGCTAAASGA